MIKVMSMRYSILIIDDEIEMCRSLSEILTSHGYNVLFSTDARKAPVLIQQNEIDFIILDIMMPEMNGINLLKAIKSKKSYIPILIITGYPSIEYAVETMKYGAVNFFVKPLDISMLLREIARILVSRDPAEKETDGYQIISRNPKMRSLVHDIKKAAQTDASVIITGESGTGKELVANYLHYHGKRRKAPFIKVNCAGLPDSLLESELFGHERGAFTDAHELRRGKFEIANSGSIFLDEIGDMSLTMQAKILRVLQENEFERLGGNHVLKVSTRVITATNKNLPQLIKDGKFREDLYYRLAVISFELPPFRERKDDIIPLSEYFIRLFATKYSKRVCSVSEEVQEVFLRHDWPGNIRELKNCIERSVIFCESDEITMSDLPSQYKEISIQNHHNSFQSMYEDVSRELIQEALSITNGVKKKAAQLLNVHRKTLYNKMKKFGLE